MHGHVVVRGADVEPEVERERIAAVVVADVASQEAAVRSRRRTAPGRGCRRGTAAPWITAGATSARRRRRQRQRLGVVVARHACRERERFALPALLGRFVGSARGRSGENGLRRNSISAAGGMCGGARRRQVRELRGPRRLELVVRRERVGERRANAARRRRPAARPSARRPRAPLRRLPLARRAYSAVLSATLAPSLPAMRLAVASSGHGNVGPP